MKKLFSVFKMNRKVSAQTNQAVTLVWVIVGLLVWQFFPVKVIPKPWEVFQASLTMWEAGLGSELISSLWLNFEAIFYSSVISLLLSYLTIFPAARPLVSAVGKLRFLGLTGLTFIFGLFLSGHELKVGLLTFGMTVFLTTSMAAVIASIPRDQFDYARTLRMSEYRVVWEVVIMGTIDEALEILRQNAAMGWIMLTMVEGLVRSEGGLGTMLLNENKHFKLEAVFALQIVILVIGLAQDYLIGYARKVLCPYADLKMER